MVIEISTCTDLELVREYNLGLEECAEILFERHRAHLDLLSRNTVNLRGIGLEDKRGIAYLTFMLAFPKYEQRNSASFITYISKCVKNVFLQEYRRQHAKKRIKDLNAVSFNSEYWQAKIDKQVYKYWKQQWAEF